MANNKIVQIPILIVSVASSQSDTNSGQMLSEYSQNRKNYLKRYWRKKYKLNIDSIILN